MTEVFSHWVAMLPFSAARGIFQPQKNNSKLFFLAGCIYEYFIMYLYVFDVLNQYFPKGWGMLLLVLEEKVAVGRGEISQ